MVDRIIQGEAREVLRGLPPESVHMAMTSIPYWGLRDYGLPPVMWADGWLGTFGLEPTIEAYVEHSVEVMREVWRVLRKDGTVFYNLADSMATQMFTRQGKMRNVPQRPSLWRDAPYVGKKPDETVVANLQDVGNLRLKPLDLCGIPWRVALALQADGWYLRSSIIWAKGREGDEEFMREVGPGSTMPESPSGTRWERHRVTECPKCGALASFRKRACKECEWRKGDKAPDIAKDRAIDTAIHAYRGDGWETQAIEGRAPEEVDYVDCPGCPKCEENDGLVLRRGSWRPTRAYEYVFLLSKTNRYFCDQEAVRESRNPRNVWYINPKGFSEWGLDFASADFIDGSGTPRKLGEDCPIHGQDGETADSLYDELRLCICKVSRTSHFATYPEELVERCIKVGTSQKGVCPACGSPWARVVADKTPRVWTDTRQEKMIEGTRGLSWGTTANIQTLGWRATCQCDAGDPIPATVLDPFVGSGTTAIVARKLGRRCIGIDLSEAYVKMTRERLARIPGWQLGLEV